MAQGGSGRSSNGYIIFDYQSPTDFKFAGAQGGSNKWVIGQRNASRWKTLASRSEAIDPNTGYALAVQIDGETVTLLAGGVEKVSKTFSGDALSDGAVGLGDYNALSWFDNFYVGQGSGANALKVLDNDVSRVGGKDKPTGPKKSVIVANEFGSFRTAFALLQLAQQSRSPLAAVSSSLMSHLTSVAEDAREDSAASLLSRLVDPGTFLREVD